MLLKGLLEWKILAAVFAILIVASSALVSNSGIKDFFLNSTGDLGDWMGDSPFGSIFATPEKEGTAVTITLMADMLELEMEVPVNVTSGDTVIRNFKGPITFDFANNRTSFVLSGSDFSFDTGLGDTTVRDVRITKLILDDMDFVVESEKTNITGTGDTIEIYDFEGDITAGRYLELRGNVSSVKDGKWSIS